MYECTGLADADIFVRVVVSLPSDRDRDCQLHQGDRASPTIHGDGTFVEPSLDQPRRLQTEQAGYIRFH